MSDEIVSALVKRSLPTEAAAIGPEALEAVLGFVKRGEPLPTSVFGGREHDILDYVNAVFTAGSFFAACVQVYLASPNDKSSAKKRIEDLERKEPRFFNDNSHVFDLIEEEMRHANDR